jgi:SAM-dependent methyltransferase
MATVSGDKTGMLPPVQPRLDAAAVEGALAAYYEQEAGVRATRALDPQRVAARDRFLARIGGERPRLLEVGIGPGRDAAAFVAAGVPVVGVDLALDHARRARTTGAAAVVATVRRLPFPGRAFGALWTMSTLMHVPDVAIAGAFAELARVLAPGALAAIGVWGGPDVEHHIAGKFDPPRFFSRRSEARWRSLLATLGPIEDFTTWAQGGDDVRYQWALVRRAEAAPPAPAT